MGLLDDAIREHLELKRRHGADESEVARQENEIFGAGRAARRPEPEAELGAEPALADEPVEPVAEPEPAPEVEAHAEPAPDVHAVPEPGAPAVREPDAAAEPEAPAVRGPDAAAEPEPEAPETPVFAQPEPQAPRQVATDDWYDEPDEVPFEDSLEHSRPRQETTEFTAAEAREAEGEEPAGEFVAPDEEPGEDLLEETPDFLQETPEHDRLWFEQKPPRDFDFGS